MAALGTSPHPVEPEPLRTSRYEHLAEIFGLTAQKQLTCGCHVKFDDTRLLIVGDHVTAFLLHPLWSGHVHESRIMALECDCHGGGRAVSMLRYDQVCLACSGRFSLISVFAVQKYYNV